MSRHSLSKDHISHCILCGGIDQVAVVEENTLFGEPFPVCFCTGCSLYYLGKQPDAALLEEYYAKVYYQAPESSRLIYTIRSWFSRMRAHSQYRYIEHSLRMSGLTGKSVLEVGCSDGSLLAVFKRKRWKVRGLEYSDFSIKKAHEVHGIEPEPKDILTLRPEEGKYDVIIFSHVLEHLPDPVKVLKHCRELLNPEGTILIELPQAPLVKECTADEFRRSLVTTHLYDFRVESLSALAKITGYSILSVDRFSYSFPRIFRQYSRLFGRVLMTGHIPAVNPAALFAIGSGITLLGGRFLMKADPMEKLEPGTPWLGLGDNIRILIRK